MFLSSQFVASPYVLDVHRYVKHQLFHEMVKLIQTMSAWH